MLLAGTVTNNNIDFKKIKWYWRSRICFDPESTGPVFLLHC